MQHARTGLQKVVIDAIRRAPKEEAPLLAWPVACGPKVAERTRALEFKGAVLRVEVPDAAWRAQLAGLIPQYLTVLNRVANVENIEFVVSSGAGRRIRTTNSEGDGR
jgi:hypothetical protein